jgi:phosphonate transport system substrate-binding protein
MIQQPPLRFLSFLGYVFFPLYEGIANFVGDLLGLPVETIQGQSFDEIGTDGQLDIAFICGLPYVELKKQHPAPVDLLAAPVLAGDRYRDRPIYFSDVIVRRDAPWHSFADLRGRSWAYNVPGSHSGYNVTRYRLLQMGETHGFFSRTIRAGGHPASIQMVCDGEADAAAIDSRLLEALSIRDPSLTAKLKIIDTLGPSTIQPVVIASSAPASLKADVRAALLAMADDPDARQFLARWSIKRFVTVIDSDYDDIREMQRAAQRAEFLTIR